MNRKSLTKNLAAAVRLLVIAMSALLVASQGETAPGAQTQAVIQQTEDKDTLIYKKYCTPGTSTFNQARCDLIEGASAGNSCADVAKRIGENSDKIKNGCPLKGKCLDLASACQREELDLADETPDAGSEGFLFMQAMNQGMTGRRVDAQKKSSEDGEMTCERALKGTSNCPELDVRDFGSAKTLEETAESLEDRKDKAMERLQDLMQKQADAQSKAQQDMLDAQEKAAQAEDDYRKTESAIINGVEKAMQEIQARKTKAYQEGRATYNKMDAAYIDLRDAVRRGASALAQAKDQLTIGCRAEANQRYEAAERTRKERIRQERQGLRNEAQTNMAGSNTRSAKRQAQERAKDYTAFYNECMAGTSTAGAGLAGEIKKMERKKADDEAKMVDQAASIEKQRLELLQQLREMEAQSMQQEQSITKQAEREINDLRAKYLKDKQTTERRMMMAQQQQMQQSQLLMGQLQSQQQRVNDLGSRANLNTQRAACISRRAGRASEDKIEERFKNNQEAIGLISSLQADCFSVVSGMCSGDKTLETARRRCNSIPEVESTPGATRATKASSGSGKARK